MIAKWAVQTALALLIAAAPFPALADTIKIGFTATLSGDFAAFGVNMRRGLEIALKEAAKDGNTYEIEAADDRGEAREGVLIAQRFCSDESIDVVMGYSFSSIALAAVPIYDGCKLPVLASAVTSPDLSNASPYFRRNVLTDAVQGKLMGTYAAEKLGLKRIYVIHQQDDYGIGVANAFAEAAKAAGAEVIGQESYLLGTKDFRTILTKIRAANPDGVFIGGFYTEAAKIAEQARALGMTAQLVGTDGSLNPELITLGRGAVEGMIVYGMFDPGLTTPEAQGFVTAYRAAHNEDPSAWAALGYDAGLTLAAAVKLASEDGEVTRESLNQAFGELKEVPGVTGPTTFEASGDRAGALYFITVQDGRFTMAAQQ